MEGGFLFDVPVHMRYPLPSTDGTLLAVACIAPPAVVVECEGQVFFLAPPCPTLQPPDVRHGSLWVPAGRLCKVPASYPPPK